jgi:hypothetical protein
MQEATDEKTQLFGKATKQHTAVPAPRPTNTDMTCVLAKLDPEQRYPHSAAMSEDPVAVAMQTLPHTDVHLAPHVLYIPRPDRIPAWLNMMSSPHH